jgi:DNA-binding LacI/PurR family transcriptional regulator
VDPKLTTVNLPANKMGLTACRLLFDEIESASEEKNSIYIPVTLKIRQSCGLSSGIKTIFGE